MNRRWEWIVESLASMHGDDAFREAYRQVGPPTVVNARLEALMGATAAQRACYDAAQPQGGGPMTKLNDCSGVGQCAKDDTVQRAHRVLTDSLREAQERAEWEHKGPVSGDSVSPRLGDLGRERSASESRLYTRDEVLFVAGAAMGGSAESALNALRYLDKGK